jgi:DNA gyrase/topoisomerase IV subunit B
MMDAKMAEDMYEGIENTLNVIVSTTGSSGNMKKELKTTIFDTVSILRKLFVKLLDTNESNAKKITELERQATNTNANRGWVTGRTNNYTAEPSSALADRPVACRGEAVGRTKNSIAEPSGALARAPYGHLEKTVSPPGGGKVRLYSEVLDGKRRPKSYKLTVTSKDNQTADEIKKC